MQKDKFKSFFKRTLAVSMATVMSLSAMYAVPAVIKDSGSFVAIEAEAASKVKVSSCKISVSSATYTGKALKPSVTVKYGKTTYKNGRDYTVSYKNNTKIGKGSVTIKAKTFGKLTGSKTVSFNIVPAKAKISSATVTTSSIKLSWGAVKGATKYEVYSYNSAKKKYTKIATTTSKSYTVKKLSTAKTYSYAVRAVAVVSKKSYYGAYSSVYNASTAPKTPTSVKVSYKTGASSATISWKKVSGASGYAVYNYDVKTKKYTYLGKTTKTSYTYKKIATATEYQFCVRAYRTVSKNNFYGSYSSKASICTAPGKVSPLKATAGNTVVELKWASQKNATGYTVYMYDSKTKTYKAKKNVSSTSYTVTGLKNGTSYKFAVEAYKTASNKKKYIGTRSSSVTCIPVNNTRLVFNDYYNTVRTGNFKIEYFIPNMFEVDDSVSDIMSGEPTMVTSIKGGKVRFDTKIALNTDSGVDLGDIDLGDSNELTLSIYYDSSKKKGYVYMLMVYQKINEAQAKENSVRPEDIREMFAPEMAKDSQIKESYETYKGKKYAALTYSAGGSTNVTIMFEGSKPKAIKITGSKESIVMEVKSFTKDVKSSDVSLPKLFPVGYWPMDIL